jgi:hypothetical protein
MFCGDNATASRRESSLKVMFEITNCISEEIEGKREESVSGQCQEAEGRIQKSEVRSSGFGWVFTKIRSVQWRHNSDVQ